MPPPTNAFILDAFQTVWLNPPAHGYWRGGAQFFIFFIGTDQLNEDFVKRQEFEYLKVLLSHFLGE